MPESYERALDRLILRVKCCPPHSSDTSDPSFKAWLALGEALPDVLAEIVPDSEQKLLGDMMIGVAMDRVYACSSYYVASGSKWQWKTDAERRLGIVKKDKNDSTPKRREFQVLDEEQFVARTAVEQSSWIQPLTQLLHFQERLWLFWLLLSPYQRLYGRKKLLSELSLRHPDRPSKSAARGNLSQSPRFQLIEEVPASVLTDWLRANAKEDGRDDTPKTSWERFLLRLDDILRSIEGEVALVHFLPIVCSTVAVSALGDADEPIERAIAANLPRLREAWDSVTDAGSIAAAEACHLRSRLQDGSQQGRFVQAVAQADTWLAGEAEHVPLPGRLSDWADGLEPLFEKIESRSAADVLAEIRCLEFLRPSIVQEKKSRSRHFAFDQNFAALADQGGVVAAIKVLVPDDPALAALLELLEDGCDLDTMVLELKRYQPDWPLIDEELRQRLLDRIKFWLKWGHEKSAVAFDIPRAFRDHEQRADQVVNLLKGSSEVSPNNPVADILGAAWVSLLLGELHSVMKSVYDESKRKRNRD